MALGDDGFVRPRETRTRTLLTELKTDKEGLYSVIVSPDQARLTNAGVRGMLHECPVPHVAATDGEGQRHVEKDAPDATRL